MNIFIILLICFISVVLVFIIAQYIKNSFWWRTKHIIKEGKKREREKEKLYKKYYHNKNKDKKDWLDELKKNGKIKIPYGAFDYIYRHIDEFGIIDKDGKIVLIDQDAYNNIIGLAKQRENIVECKKEDKKRSYYDITVGEDGTMVKRDNIDKTLTIKKPSGEVIFTKGEKTIIDKTECKKEIEEEKQFAEKEENNKYKGIENIITNNLSKQKETTKPIKKPKKKTKINIEEFMDELESEIDNETDEKNEKQEKEEEREMQHSKPTINNSWLDKNINFENLDDFCMNITATTIKDLLIDTISFASNYEYPVIVIDKNDIYLDVVFFIYVLRENIEDKNRQKFNELFFKNNEVKKSSLIKLIKCINTTLFNISLCNLFKILKRDNGIKCVFKKTYNYDGKLYTNIFLQLDISVLNKIKIDFEYIKNVNFIDNKKGGFFISNNINF